ncbi:MAG: hypothetical protein HYS16_00865 [Deltaproteobacteria bacterium]|nr:MAG: hypothetical protein HYS16_00865 [Deltaproteobacteria bacterium]
MLNIDKSLFFQLILIFILIRFLQRFLLAPIINLIEQRKLYFIQLEEEIKDLQNVRKVILNEIEGQVKLAQKEMLKNIFSFRQESDNMCKNILENIQEKAFKEIELSKRIVLQAKLEIYNDLKKYRDYLKMEIMKKYFISLQNRQAI